MKFDKSKDQDVATRDAECYRKFLAGNRTLFTQAFWDNGPRSSVESAEDSGVKSMLELDLKELRSQERS